MSALSFSNVTVAPLRVEDLPRVLDIERLSNAHPWSERNFQDALASGYLCLVAREGEDQSNGNDEREHVFGFAVARVLLDEAELLLLAVAPERRRQGVAALLWQAISERLYINGARVLHLEVREHNTVAQCFYQTRGLTVSGRRKRYYPSGADGAPGEDAILMQGTLSP